MLELENISKTFAADLFAKKMTALKSITLAVNRGEVYAFIGPNGAGKTTTIKLILGLIFPDSGRIFVNGIDYRNKLLRRQVGYLPDQPYFYDDLTAIEYLKFSGKLFFLSNGEIDKKIKSLIPQVGLSGKENVRLRHFSRGMLQRLGMAQALIHDPNLLILDEPMTGLDPLGRKEFRDFILQLRQQGKTIFFSSHILADAEMIGDRVGILNHGCLIKEMQLNELLSTESQGVEIIFRKPETAALADNFPWKVEMVNHNGIISLEDENAVFQAVEWVQHAGGQIVSISPKRKTLEDIFIQEVKQ